MAMGETPGHARADGHRGSGPADKRAVPAHDVAKTVVLVDGYALVRKGMRAVLEAQASLRVVGEAGDSDSAISEVALQQPDVVLFDIDMWQDRVTPTVRKIREMSPKSRIVVLTTNDNPHLLGVLVLIGIRAYLVKSVGWSLLISAIHETCVQNDNILLLLSQQSFPRIASRNENLLSPRELEVLELVSFALSNVQIASHLRVSEATIKRHLRNIFVKLGAVSRIDAVNKAAAAFLIASPSGQPNSMAGAVPERGKPN
ncbi:response regulator transcription factor [Asanoa iriomotensis]